MRIEGRLANQVGKIIRTRGEAVPIQTRSPLRVSVVKMLQVYSMSKSHTPPTAVTRGLSSLGLAITSGLSPASVSVHPSSWFHVPEGVPIAEPGQMSESRRGWQMGTWGMKRKSLAFSDNGLGRKALPITKIYKGRFLTPPPTSWKMIEC